MSAQMQNGSLVVAFGAYDYSLVLGLAALGAQMRADVRPREWEKELMELLPAASSDSAAGVLTELVRYYHALDWGEVDVAGRCLDGALDGYWMAPQHRTAVALEGAYFEGFHRQNTVLARWCLQNAVEPGDAALRCRAEAAVLFAEGRWTEACARARAGLSIPCLNRVERVWLEAVLQRCEEGRDSLPCCGDRNP